MLSSLLRLLGIKVSDTNSTNAIKSNINVEENNKISKLEPTLHNELDYVEYVHFDEEAILYLEESDIPGIYFNEFREYVDEEGNILSPSEVDRLRYKGDYEDDYYR